MILGVGIGWLVKWVQKSDDTWNTHVYPKNTDPMLVNINDAIVIPGKLRFQLQSVWNVLHLCLLKIKSTYLVSILFLYMNIYIIYIYIPRPSSPKNGGLPHIIIHRFQHFLPEDGQQAPRRPSLLGFELIEAPNALLSYGLMSHKSMVILGDDGWDGRIFLMHSYFASSCFITIITAWPRVWSANSLDLDLEQY